MTEIAFVVGAIGGVALAGLLLGDRLEQARERIAILEKRLLEQHVKED